MTDNDITLAAIDKYPALQPDAEELTYPRSALREFRRAAFVEGAKWARGNNA